MCIEITHSDRNSRIGGVGALLTSQYSVWGVGWMQGALGRFLDETERVRRLNIVAHRHDHRGPDYLLVMSNPTFNRPLFYIHSQQLPCRRQYALCVFVRTILSPTSRPAPPIINHPPLSLQTKEWIRQTLSICMSHFRHFLLTGIMLVVNCAYVAPYLRERPWSILRCTVRKARRCAEAVPRVSLQAGDVHRAHLNNW